MAQYKIGDTVCLKSGSPLMTVTGVGTDSSSGSSVVWTAWFDKSGNEKTGYYPADAVAPDDDAPPTIA